MSVARATVAAIVASALVIAPVARGQDAPSETSVARGVSLPGFAVAVEPRGGDARVLCEPECALRFPLETELRVGWRRGDVLEWRHEVRLERDLRLDVRLEDHSDVRAVAYALLVATGVLLLATAIVGIATEPEPPELGWFGPNHALVFAGIAGGIVLAFGVPGVGIALAFERDTPAIEIVPEE